MKSPTKRLLRSLAALGIVAGTTVVVGSGSASATSTIVSGEAFLQGTYLEVGIAANGRAGSGNAAPAGFHARSSSGKLGFRVDRGEDGWGVGIDDGDFFVPGSPFEGWGVQVGTTSYFNNDVDTQVTGSLSNLSTAGGSQSVTWTGTSAGVQVRQVYSVPTSKKALNIDITYTNTTGATINNLYYYRGVDPDNNQTINGSYTTTQLITSASSPAMVQATQTDGSFLLLNSLDSRAKVAYGATSSWLRSGFTIANLHSGAATNNVYTTGTSTTVDGAIYLTVNAGSLAPGASTTFRVSYLLAAASADLSTVATGPGTLTPGTTGNVTLTIANAGPDAAEGTIGYYTPPAGVTVDVANLPAGCSGPAAGPIQCSAGDLDVLGTSVLSIPVRVPSSAAPGATYPTGVVRAASGTPDANGSTTASPIITVGPRVADLTVAAAGPTTIVPGDTAAVTLTVANNGPSDTPSSSTVYTPPAGVAIDMANLPTGCVADSPVAGSVTCDTGAIASGGSVAVAIPLTIGSGILPAAVFTGGSATTVTLEATDADGASVVPPDITAAGGVSNLTTVVSDPGPITPGDTTSVDITTTNSGPSDAHSVIVTYTPPTGVVIDMSNLPVGCAVDSPIAGSTTCDRGTIVDGADTTVTIPVTVTASAVPAATLSLDGAASASSDSTDPDGDLAAADLSTAAGEADLSIVASDPGPVTPGTTAVVTVTATNAGPSDSPSTQVVYTPPTGVTIDVDNLPETCSADTPVAGTVTCDLDLIALSGSGSVDIPVLVGASVTPSSALDDGSVSADSLAIDPTDDAVDSTVTTGAAIADIALTVTPPPSITPGTSDDVVIDLVNNGPSDSTESTTVVYSPPVGTSIDAANLPAGCVADSPTAGSTTCTVGSLANGATAQLLIPVSVPSSAANDTTFIGGLAASSNPNDTNASNDGGVSTVTAGEEVSDLTTTVSDPGPVVPGTASTVVVTTANAGFSDALNTSVHYTPPTGVSIDWDNLPAECAADPDDAASVDCDLGTIASGAAGIASIPVIVASDATPSATLSGGAAGATSDSDDPDGDAASADLSTDAANAGITVTVDADAPIVPGTTGSVTITATNNGPSDTDDDTIAVYSSPIGSAIDMANLPAGCIADSPTTDSITCTFEPLVDGASASVVIPIVMPAAATPGGTLSGGAVNVSNPDDVDTLDNSAPSTIPVAAARADLSTTVSNVAPLVPGSTATITLTTANAGPSHAANTIVSYTPPPGVAVDMDNLPAGCIEDPDAAGSVLCDLGTVVSGGFKTADVPITLAASAAPGTTLIGAADSTSDATDDDGAAADAALDTAAAEADLAITVSDPGPVVPGETAIVDVVVTNNGPSDAATSVVVYTPPGGAALDMAALPTGCIADAPSAGSTTCAVGTIAAGDTATLELPLIVNSDAPGTATLTGADVDASTDATDNTPGNSTDVAGDLTTGVPAADLALSVVSVPTIGPDETGTVELRVTNNGPSDSGSVTVTYPLVTGVEFDADAANPSACTVDEGVVSCIITGPIANGDVADVTIPVKVVLQLGSSGVLAPATAELTDQTVADATTDNDSTLASVVLDLAGDTDGDGLPDSVEIDPLGSGTPLDTDDDGTPDYLDLDSDNDGIPDAIEAGADPANPVDSDNDGVADYLDLDSDNDGILDAVEAGADPANPVDSDNDSVADYLDLDSDGDGIFDVIEGGNGAPETGRDANGDGVIDEVVDTNGDGLDDNAATAVIDTNNDGTPDAQSLDADGDGIPDSVEAGADPANPVDSDDDGTPDYADVDSDGDGILDGVEAGPDPANPADSDEDGVPDYLDGDSDNDGITDANEAGDDPLNPTDTDDDGTPDYRDLDSDGDGIHDVIEGGNGRLDLDGDGAIDDLVDADGDGIDDAATTTIVDTNNDGTPDAQSLDADGDGLPDSAEAGANAYPLDTDGDGVPDYADVDSDGDGILDAVEASDGPDTDGDGVPNHLDRDSDNDGITDANETGDDPANPIDTDEDGTPDYLDLDSDGDGIFDIIEGGNTSLDPNRDGTIDELVDENGDGLDDRAKTVIVDTDGDGVPDARSLDSDGDGASDADESGDDPLADSDGDGVPNYIDPVGKTISGQVFWDLNRNGRIDADETDISNVQVWLMTAGADGKLGTTDDVKLRTATTHSPYVFADVPAGRYIVKIDRSTLPKGVYITDDEDGSKDQLVTVEIDSADEMSIDFGQNFAMVTGIFRDAKGNPMPNARVTFTDAEGNTFVVTTGADGSFTVEGSASNPLIVGNAVVSGLAADGTVVTQNVMVTEGADNTVMLEAPTPAAKSSIPSSLAFTGSTISSLLIVALGLGGAGLLLVGSTRRRRT